MSAYHIGPETKRLNHRALTVDDAESFFALNSHPDVIKFTGEPLLTSVREAREAIANYPDFDTVGYGRWACVLKDTQEVIGICGLKYLADLDAVHVGYRFLPQYWSQGLATEACAASLRFGFETLLKLRRIIGLVLPENVASMRVLQKVGMHRIENILYEGQDAIQFEIRSSDAAMK